MFGMMYLSMDGGHWIRGKIKFIYLLKIKLTATLAGWSFYVDAFFFLFEDFFIHLMAKSYLTYSRC